MYNLYKSVNFYIIQTRTYSIAKRYSKLKVKYYQKIATKQM